MPPYNLPNPRHGSAGDVTVDKLPVRLLVDENGDLVQYEENDPERFADKMSLGDPRYGDFNPYETPFAIGHFDGGYGLDRFSDLNSLDLGIGVNKETPGVDCRFGPAFLAPLLTIETMSGATQTPVWCGEFNPVSGAVAGNKFVAISGAKIFYRTGGGAWVDTGTTLAGNAVQGAVAVVGGRLIIGYGAAAIAQFVPSLDNSGIGNVTDSGANTLYVFAATADRSAVYIAGGTSNANTNNVLSAPVTAANPATAFGLAASAIVCGGTDRPITALSPGGATLIGNGQALLFVTNTKELGAIAEITVVGGSTPVAVYLVLMSFDSALAINGQGFRWWQGTGEEAQRGATVLVFNRDHSPWVYSPAGASAQNIAVWAIPGYNPPNIQGRATCFQGTARWLYYGITNSAGHSWLLCRDSHPQQSGSLTQGALVSSVASPTPTHSLLDLGVNACQTLGLTSLFGNPMLFVGYGNGIASMVLPLDGENPLHDSTGNCRFGATGTQTIPDVDHNFPAEVKYEVKFHLVHDNVSPGAQDITLYVSLDGGSFTQLGQAGTGTDTLISFVVPTAAKRVTPQLVFSTTDPTKTPVLRALTVEAIISPLLFKEYVFQGKPSDGTQPYGGQDLQNPYTMKQHFFNLRSTSQPFTFLDVWQDPHIAVLTRFRVKHVRHPVNQPPEMNFFFDILEVAPGGGNVVYGGSLAVYGAATSKYA